MKHTPIALTLLALSTLWCFSTLAQEQNAQPFTEASEDRLGEPLREFLSRHKEASCHRRPSDENAQPKHKIDWLAWVDCGFYKRSFIATQGNQPFGTYATFRNKKLVELGYGFRTESLESVILGLHRSLGEPSQVSYTKGGEFQSAIWVIGKVTARVEIITLPPLTADGQTLRIGEGVRVRAVQVRLDPSQAEAQPENQGR